jgi:hypothetical protein
VVLPIQCLQNLKENRARKLKSNGQRYGPRETPGLNTTMPAIPWSSWYLAFENVEQSCEEESASTRSCRIQVHEILNEDERKEDESREDEILARITLKWLHQGQKPTMLLKRPGDETCQKTHLKILLKEQNGAGQREREKVLDEQTYFWVMPQIPTMDLFSSSLSSLRLQHHYPSLCRITRPNCAMLAAAEHTQYPPYACQCATHA